MGSAQIEEKKESEVGGVTVATIHLRSRVFVESWIYDLGFSLN